MDRLQLEIEWLTRGVRALRILRFGEREMERKNNPPRNLLRLAGVINSANREADDEAGALIARIQKNQRRTLGLIAKGHSNEKLREQMLSEAEKEQALSELAAAVGDNGAPLDVEADAESEKVREELRAAKSPHTSNSSSETDQQQPPPVPQDDAATEVDRAELYPASVQYPASAQFQRR